MKSGHRFYLPQQLDKEILVVRDRAMIHQMRDVLKMRRGEQAIFFNDKPDYLGYDFVAELKNIEAGLANFMLREQLENHREPSKKLVLYQSLIKKDGFEWILQKGTEVGVSEFVPVVAAHSEKKTLNRLRCEVILKEAAEQSGRASIPKLQREVSFEKAVFLAGESGFKTHFADLREKENMVHGVGERAINLFIGPEGGWDDEEIFAAGRANFEAISLGRLTLRSETAAIAASYTLLWG